MEQPRNREHEHRAALTGWSGCKSGAENVGRSRCSGAHRRLIYGDDDVPERDGSIRAPNCGAEASCSSPGIDRDPKDEHAAADPEGARLGRSSRARGVSATEWGDYGWRIDGCVFGGGGMQRIVAG
eukprot:scaffold28624_cov128-Isochrysis_galbana.AAC.2